MLKNYSTNGTVKNTCLNIQYDTIQTRSYLENNTNDNNSIKNGYVFLKHSRILYSITDNHLSSRFLRDDNYLSFDNNIFMTDDKAMTNQSTTCNISLTIVDYDIFPEVYLVLNI